MTGATGGLLGASGVCAIFTAVALWAAIDAVAWRRWRACAKALVAAVLLAGAAGGLFWLGVTHPVFDLRNNQGFPAT